MRIKVEEIANFKETEVTVRCEKRDETVEKIVMAVQLLTDQTFLAKKDGLTYPIIPADIYYFESVDDKVFLYTKDAVFEYGLRLYEIENRLLGTSFLRVNKNTIIDSAKIVSFKSTLNGRMEARLKNRDFIEISRSYVPALKWMLGGTPK